MATRPLLGPRPNDMPACESSASGTPSWVPAVRTEKHAPGFPAKGRHSACGHAEVAEDTRRPCAHSMRTAVPRKTQKHRRDSSGRAASAPSYHFSQLKVHVSGVLRVLLVVCGQPPERPWALPAVSPPCLSWAPRFCRLHAIALAFTAEAVYVLLMRVPALPRASPVRRSARSNAT